MNVTEVLIGVGLVLAAILALRIAVPPPGRSVRGWLQGDTRQSLYAVMVLSVFALGIVNIVTGLVP